MRSSLTWALTDGLVDWSGLVHSRKTIEEVFFSVLQSSLILPIVSYLPLLSLKREERANVN